MGWRIVYSDYADLAIFAIDVRVFVCVRCDVSTGAYIKDWLGFKLEAAVNIESDALADEKKRRSMPENFREQGKWAQKAAYGVCWCDVDCLIHSLIQTLKLDLRDF